MFAVVVRESGDAKAIAASWDMVTARVAPRVAGAPGFVSALWMSDRSGRTLNILVFDSEEAATAALEAAGSSSRPPFMKLDDVELLQVMATA